jgi:hypothetical protein
LRQVTCGSAYLSGQSLVQHFGLGEVTTIDAIDVQWPSGATSHLEHVPADQLLRLTEGDANAVVLHD